MANAEGGYILIGVQEKDKIAQGFFDVPDAESEVDSIYKTCHQHINPPITKLEVKPRKLRLPNREVNLIVIHIPFSENRPHGFNLRGTLNFVKRYADITKAFDMEEFIPDLIARHHLSSIDDIRKLLEDDIRGQLDRIEHQTTDILKKIGENE